MEHISDSLVYKMDPDNISTKYLETTLAPLLKQAVLKPKQHQDNGDHKVCITTSAPQQHHVQSAWPSHSVEQNCDSAKKKESLSAQGGMGVGAKKRLRGGVTKSGTTPGKTKRWGRRTNGLFGWISTSVKKTESKSKVNEVENIPVENSNIFKLRGQKLKPDNSGLVKPLSGGNSRRK